MNLAAAAGYFAVFGMPMPSGLLMFAATPLTPGVGMYLTLPTTEEVSGTS
jgi:hypothetical protein